MRRRMFNNVSSRASVWRVVFNNSSSSGAARRHRDPLGAKFLNMHRRDDSEGAPLLNTARRAGPEDESRGSKWPFLETLDERLLNTALHDEPLGRELLNTTP